MYKHKALHGIASNAYKKNTLISDNVSHITDQLSTVSYETTVNLPPTKKQIVLLLLILSSSLCGSANLKCGLLYFIRASITYITLFHTNILHQRFSLCNLCYSVQDYKMAFQQLQSRIRLSIFNLNFYIRYQLAKHCIDQQRVDIEVLDMAYKWQ